MCQSKQFKEKLPLILISAILIVCAGFVFVSCGSGIDPQLKVNDPYGEYALDFTDCPSDKCRLLIPDASQNGTRTIANKELAVEAWVKSRAVNAAALTGGILGRIDTAGIGIYVKGGVPKAAIRRVGASGTATATADYIASSGMQILDTLWHHIAAILTGDDHSNPANPDFHVDCTNTTDTVDCRTDTVCNDDIHLDIYVDGVYKDCNTTYGEDNDTLVTAPAFAEEPGDIFLGVGVLGENLTETLDDLDHLSDFPGIIDEPRLWGSDVNGNTRSRADILACMNRELGINTGVCSRNQDMLLAYLRLNDGVGSSANEWTGLDSAILEIFSPALHLWTTGWTTDTPPGLTRAD